MQRGRAADGERPRRWSWSSRSRPWPDRPGVALRYRPWCSRATCPVRRPAGVDNAQGARLAPGTCSSSGTRRWCTSRDRRAGSKPRRGSRGGEPSCRTPGSRSRRCAGEATGGPGAATVGPALARERELHGGLRRQRPDGARTDARPCASGAAGARRHQRRRLRRPAGVGVPHPPLTTVRQDFAELGRRTMALVERVLAGEEQPRSTWCPPRSWSAPPRRRRASIRQRSSGIPRSAALTNRLTRVVSAHTARERSHSRLRRHGGRRRGDGRRRLRHALGSGGRGARQRRRGARLRRARVPARRARPLAARRARRRRRTPRPRLGAPGARRLRRRAAHRRAGRAGRRRASTPAG